MKHIVTAVFDKKAAHYSKVVCVPAEGAAVRALQDAVNQKDSEYNKHPEDYSMWVLGTYDDISGELEPVKPKHLAEAAALLDLSKTV